MPTAGSPTPSFLGSLRARQTVVVSSRDPGGEGKVRMWFALADSGRIYLLTPSFSLKARRWAKDPWVRLRAGGEIFEGRVEPVGPADFGPDQPLLLERFAMAGAVTGEALQWMLESGSHQLFQVVGAPPDRPET